MQNIFRRALILGALALITACGSETVQAPAEPKPYRVSSVVVNLAENAQVRGRFEDAELRNSVLKRIDTTLTELVSAKAGGAQRASAVVTITAMQLRDSGARSFGGVNSVNGQMTIVSPSGATLDGPFAVSYSDQARNNTTSFNGIPIGLLINASRNSRDQEEGVDVDTLVEGFASKAAVAF